jgi:hypothetical protein
MGIGTLISVMLPYSIGFGIFSTLLLVVWIFFGIPLGPDAPMFYDITTAPGIEAGNGAETLPGIEPRGEGLPDGGNGE